MSRTIDVYSTNKEWHVNAETGTLLRRRSGDERTAVNVNRRHSKEKWKSKGKKGGRERERGTEREFGKLPEHCEFKTSVRLFET